ncbi:hypothetical protein H2198_001111 [Neophaeococcomyces mojaviensis]|uniref:Uncharacterized protein n=1 Tax=Neophaeococcomyces mojaviensis TaxID=3383035 RepID=A0ACC3AID4_9EURO|nr:hypothetical protein H2198_001111 [Knufia sp. JES_112]
MRTSSWLRLLALPGPLRVLCAEQLVDDLPRLADDATYNSGLGHDQDILGPLPCPDYTQYAVHKHRPFSDGPLSLPFQRPHKSCRKFTSPEVEQVIQDLYPRLKDRDLAHIFQNAFPNTLDTTVLWHVDGESTHAGKSKYMRYKDNAQWNGAQSFIVTGDINAEWLRDSTNQLAQYQLLAKTAPDISNLIRGAIATQAEFVIESPYCNAFQPPGPSGLDPSNNGQQDTVHPLYEPSTVFECKYELDSLANFLSLGNQYHAATGSTKFLTSRWFFALRTLIEVLKAQSLSTFTDVGHKYHINEYTFSRWTNIGTETLNLRGGGNPLANHTGLIRSAFRPSDDATILQFLIPSNAMMSVELERTATLLSTFKSSLPKDTPQSDRDAVSAYIDLCSSISTRIRAGIFKHAVVDHPTFGRVFAYETDGYGSHILMDDANIPSLLSLPLLGFITDSTSSEIYQNTRKMVLSTEGNPYFLTGPSFTGIGGPHIGLANAWPMSVLMQAMTSDNDTEILECLERVKNVSVFGLINESVDVRVGVDKRTGMGMTRSWFAWANSVFAQTVLWLVEKKPELMFETGREKYVVGEGFVRV